MSQQPSKVDRCSGRRNRACLAGKRPEFVSRTSTVAPREATANRCTGSLQSESCRWMKRQPVGRTTLIPEPASTRVAGRAAPAGTRRGARSRPVRTKWRIRGYYGRDPALGPLSGDGVDPSDEVADERERLLWLLGLRHVRALLHNDVLRAHNRAVRRLRAGRRHLVVAAGEGQRRRLDPPQPPPDVPVLD